MSNVWRLGHPDTNHLTAWLIGQVFSSDQIVNWSPDCGSLRRLPAANELKSAQWSRSVLDGRTGAETSFHSCQEEKKKVKGPIIWRRSPHPQLTRPPAILLSFIRPFLCHTSPTPCVVPPSVNISFLYFFCIWDNNKKGFNFLYNLCVWFLLFHVTKRKISAV